jgi:hypothetical protein
LIAGHLAAGAVPRVLLVFVATELAGAIAQAGMRKTYARLG